MKAKSDIFINYYKSYPITIFLVNEEQYVDQVQVFSHCKTCALTHHVFQF